MDSQLSFVTNQYRTVDKQDTGLKAKFSNARIVNIQTNLDLNGALRRLDEELAAGGVTRAFEVAVEQIYLPDDFIGGPPSFNVYSPADGLNGETLTVFEVGDVNLSTGVSVLRMR